MEEEKVQIVTTEGSENAETPQRPVRKYNTGFGKKKGNDELEAGGDKICPFRDCGRKFPSDGMLGAHMGRRHKAPEPKTEEQSVSGISSTASSETPIPNKNKSNITDLVTSTLPLDSIEEEKKK